MCFYTMEKMPEFCFIAKQYHLKCKNNINVVLYLGFADIILGAFNKIEIFIQDTGLVEYRL